MPYFTNTLLELINFEWRIIYSASIKPLFIVSDLNRAWQNGEFKIFRQEGLQTRRGIHFEQFIFFINEPTNETRGFFLFFIFFYIVKLAMAHNIYPTNAEEKITCIHGESTKNRNLGKWVRAECLTTRLFLFLRIVNSSRVQVCKSNIY